MNMISIFISSVALAFTAASYWKQYLYKKTILKMTVCETKLEDNKLTAIIVFANLGTQCVTISNCYIQLGNSMFGIDLPRHRKHSFLIEPFTLYEKQQKCVAITDELPDIESKIEWNIYVTSIGPDNCKYSDLCQVGTITKNNQVKHLICTEHAGHEILKTKVIESTHF